MDENHVTQKSTTLRISLDAWKLINREKRIGENMSDVVVRVFEEYNKQDILKE